MRENADQKTPNMVFSDIRSARKYSRHMTFDAEWVCIKNLEVFQKIFKVRKNHKMKVNLVILEIIPMKSTLCFLDKLYAYLKPLLHSYRNQSIDLEQKSIE